MPHEAKRAVGQQHASLAFLRCHYFNNAIAVVDDIFFADDSRLAVAADRLWEAEVDWRSTLSLPDLFIDNLFQGSD